MTTNHAGPRLAATPEKYSDGCSQQTPAVGLGRIVGGLLGGAVVKKAFDAFHDACRSHDYGYDVLRHAWGNQGFQQRPAGRFLLAADRHQADDELYTMMGSVCDKTGFFGIFAKDTCQGMRQVMYRVVQQVTMTEFGPPK